MEEIKRLMKLLSLISEAGGEIHGRKKLQKLIYLLQIRGHVFGYDFDFYNYGVFSHSLASDLASAVASNKIEEKIRSDEIYPYYLIKNISGQKNDEGFKFDNIDRELFQKKSSFLEVLSTIIYLKKNGYKGEKLEEKLQELKGQLKKEFKGAFKFANDNF